ncbi:MAG: hypothetical protein PHS41_06070 [Victivallaceae bacterium]|nr:hypothetical protein [Victivallaceae bacterium]
MNQARDKARGIKCISNLKQMHIPIWSYTDDYNCMVRNGAGAGYGSTTDPGMSSWGYLLSITGYIQALGNQKGKYYESFGIFTCPSGSTPIHANYGLNGAGRETTSGYENFRGGKWKRVQNPSRKVLVAEAAGQTWEIGAYYSTGRWQWRDGFHKSGYYWDMNSPHNGKTITNILYADGHAAPFKRFLEFDATGVDDRGSFAPSSNDAPKFQ